MSEAFLNYAQVKPRVLRVRTRTALAGVIISVLWCVAAVVVLVFLTGALYAALPLAVVVSPLLGILLLTSVAEAARSVRRQRAMVIFGYLHQAVRLNLPLATMLASARHAERGRTRKRLGELLELTQMGLPVGESLQFAVPEVSDRAASLIGAAERNGTLERTLGRLLDENRRTTPSDPLNTAFHRAYPLALLLMLVLALSTFLIFVMPKYEQIFLDFGVQLPAVTMFVLDFGNTLLMPVAFIVVAVSFVVIGRSFEQFFVVRSSLYGRSRGLTDRLAWATPFAHGIARDEGLADVFQTLADAAQHGQPLPRALEEAARLPINVVLTGRITRWRAALEAGAAPTDAARAARFPAIVVGLLATARSVDDTAAVFGFLARYYRTRFSRTRALVRGALVPGIVLVAGVCVCTVALAMFVPLLRLIDAIARSDGF